MSDYGLKITIHDLAGAVSDAVDRAHSKYEPKFYDWMRSEIEGHVNDAIDSNNANTEKVLGVNEIEEMIDNMLSDHDFSMTIEDIINYNFDFVTECDVPEIVRDYCDGEEFLRASDVTDVTAFENQVRTLEAQALGLQAEVDFLHEKYMDLLERRLSYRIGETVRTIRSLPARLWARVPKFTITRKDNNNA